MTDPKPTFSVEEVAAPPPTPARPTGGKASVGRAVDFLDGFLNPAPATQLADAPGGELYESVIEALKQIHDPEIPVNIYDLGLIYGVEINGGHADVTMTLTTPHCPVAESMPAEVELRVGSVPGIGSATVALVWDPPWDPQKMSDEAKLELGML